MAYWIEISEKFIDKVADRVIKCVVDEVADHVVEQCLDKFPAHLTATLVPEIEPKAYIATLHKRLRPLEVRWLSTRVY